MIYLLENVYFWLISIGFIFITGLLAGSYPALYLSSFKPVKVLKGTFRDGRFAADSTESPCGNAILRFSSAYHKYYCCLPASTVCEKQARRIYDRKD